MGEKLASDKRSAPIRPALPARLKIGAWSDGFCVCADASKTTEAVELRASSWSD